MDKAAFRNGSVQPPMNGSSIVAKKRTKRRKRDQPQRSASAFVPSPDSANQQEAVHGDIFTMETRLLKVSQGEDVHGRILAFAQTVRGELIVYSAVGTVSSVSIRPLGPHDDDKIYEGSFDILSLTGSFRWRNSQSAYKRKGSIKVSFAGRKNKMFAGTLSGPMIAAGEILIVVFFYDKVSASQSGNYLTPAPADQADDPHQDAADEDQEDQKYDPVGAKIHAVQTANGHQA